MVYSLTKNEDNLFLIFFTTSSFKIFVISHKTQLAISKNYCFRVKQFFGMNNTFGSFTDPIISQYGTEQ